MWDYFFAQILTITPQTKSPDLRLNRCIALHCTVLFTCACARTCALFFAALHYTVSFAAPVPMPALHYAFNCTCACACARDYAIHSWGSSTYD